MWDLEDVIDEITIILEAVNRDGATQEELRSAVVDALDVIADASDGDDEEEDETEFDDDDEEEDEEMEPKEIEA